MADQTPIAQVVTDDAGLVALRGLYDVLKAQYAHAKQALEEAEEKLKAAKLLIEAELYGRSGGALVADLRVAGVEGALRMRQKSRTFVDKDKLESSYPEIYEQVKRVAYYWELREVK